MFKHVRKKKNCFNPWKPECKPDECFHSDGRGLVWLVRDGQVTQQLQVLTFLFQSSQMKPPHLKKLNKIDENQKSSRTMLPTLETFYKSVKHSKQQINRKLQIDEKTLTKDQFWFHDVASKQKKFKQNWPFFFNLLSLWSTFQTFWF